MQALALDERVGSTQDRRRRCAPTQGATVPERRTRAPGRDSKQANRQPPLKTAARRHRAAKHGAAAPPGLLRGLGREAEAHGPPRAPHLRPGPVYNERADRGRPPVGLGLPAPPRALALRRVPAVRPGRPAHVLGPDLRRRRGAAAGDGGRRATARTTRGRRRRGGAARPTRAPGASRRSRAASRRGPGPGAYAHIVPAARRSAAAATFRSGTRRGPFRAVPGPGGSWGPGGCAAHQTDRRRRGASRSPGARAITGAAPFRSGTLHRPFLRPRPPKPRPSTAPALVDAVESEAAGPRAARRAVGAPRPGRRRADPDAAAARAPGDAVTRRRRRGGACCVRSAAGRVTCVLRVGRQAVAALPGCTRAGTPILTRHGLHVPLLSK